MSPVMKTIATAALLAVASATACGDEPMAAAGRADSDATRMQANVSGNPGDIVALQQIVNTFDQAWTAGDYVTYASQYAGGEWVGPNGVVLTDPAAITATYQFILTVLLPNTTRQSTIRNITFLTGTIAVLDIDTRVTGFDPNTPGLVPWQPGILRALERNILMKRGGRWQIVLHQQTFVAPPLPGS